MANAGRGEDNGGLCGRNGDGAGGRPLSSLANPVQGAPNAVPARLPGPHQFRVVLQPRVPELLDYCAAVGSVIDHGTVEIDFCREKLSLPPEELNPPPLITGEDLKQLGIPRGPIYRTLLDAVRDAQLLKQVVSREEALDLVRRLQT